MKTLIKRIVRGLGNAYIREICKREYLQQTFTGINERPVEFRFVFENLASICPKHVLDVGTGMTALPHLIRNCGFQVTAIDNIKDYWSDGLVNRHFHVVNDDIRHTALKRKFDFITCVSVIEHIREHERAVASMYSLLEPGGHLLISCPYNESNYVDNVYKLPGSVGAEKFQFVTQVFSRKQIDGWLAASGGVLVKQEFWRFFTGEYWTIGDRICPPENTGRDQPHQITCVLIRKPD